MHKQQCLLLGGSQYIVVEMFPRITILLGGIKDGSRHPSQEGVRSRHVIDARSPVLEDRLAFHSGVVILRCVGSLV